MSPTTPMLAFGNLLVSLPNDEKKHVRFEVFHDGIKFYQSLSTPDSTDFFKFIQTHTGTARRNSITGQGHLTLFSLPASPRPVFSQVKLKYNDAGDPKSFSLEVVHSGPFAHQAGIFFQNLNLTFTEFSEDQGAGKLSVSGEVEAVFLDRQINLEAELSETALFFKNNSQLQPSIVEIDKLGTVSLTNFEVGTDKVGTDQRRREGCQVLYAFDENSGAVVHDSSGVGDPLDLKIHDPKAVDWLSGGGLKIKASTSPILLASEVPATKIIKAVSETNEITVEAWVTPANITQDGPARIVSISADTSNRNLTLGQKTGVYDVRLRNTKENINGTRPSTSTPNKTLTTDRTYVVYTFKDGLAIIYLNGVEVVPKEVKGDLSNWDVTYRLALANELTKDLPGQDRQWHGELHQIAIYNRALTKEEIQRNYFPTIQARGTMTLADVPAPLNEPTKEVEFTFLPDQDLPDLPAVQSERNLFSIAQSGAMRYELNVAKKEAIPPITPFLHFERVQLAWEGAQDTPWTLSGKVMTALWQNDAHELEAMLAQESGAITLQKQRQFQLSLAELGDLKSIKKFVLQGDQAGLWNIDIDEEHAKLTFSVMPRPLVGPFDARPRLDQGQLWLKLEEIRRINLTRDFRLLEINLDFVRVLDNWRGSGTASAQLFGGHLPISIMGPNVSQTENRVSLQIGHIGNLIELMPPVGSSGPLVYDFGPMRIEAYGVVLSESEYPQGWWNADDTAKFVKLAGIKVTPALQEKLGSLILFDRNSSKAVDDNAAITFFVGNWTIPRVVDLTVWLGLAPSLSKGYGNGFSIEGYLAKKDDNRDFVADFVAFSATGRIIIRNDKKSPVQLEGTSSLKVLDKEIFSGDIQQKDDKFVLTGEFNLFPDWSPLQLGSEDENNDEVKITDDGSVKFKGAAKFDFPEFDLIGPKLELQNGSLRLHGQWLGHPIALTGIRRDAHFILQGDVTFSVPFSLTLGPIYEPQTGVKVADSISVCQDENCWQTMTMNVVVELSASGFVAKVNGEFQWQRETDTRGTGPKIKVPELTLYRPPTNQNAILSLIVDEVKAQAYQLFAGKVKRADDYFVTLDSEQPQLFFSNTGSHEAQISSDMPAIFKANENEKDEISSPNSIFTLKQTGETCKLTLNIEGKDQAAIREDYDKLLIKIADSPPKDALLSAGAAAVLKRRIAERLPLDYDNLLYYYYGWDVEKGYLDLQAGMRLRIDLQNYQFVQASDPTAQRGFAGSGSFYVPVNSYNYPQSDGSHAQLLGFGPFLSRLQVNGDLDITNKGAGGVFDLLKDGYRKAYYRLFFPKQPSTGASSERSVTLIGASSLKEIADATNAFVKSGSSASTMGTSFFFRGKAVILPEIQVYVGSKPTYVPVGTTIRQLLEMFDDIPSAGLPGQDLHAFSGAARPMRLVHEGVNSEPTYRGINLGRSGSTGNMDVLDLPLVRGDRFFF